MYCWCVNLLVSVLQVLQQSEWKMVKWVATNTGVRSQNQTTNICTSFIRWTHCECCVVAMMATVTLSSVTTYLWTPPQALTICTFICAVVPRLNCTSGHIMSGCKQVLTIVFVWLLWNYSIRKRTILVLNTVAMSFFFATTPFHATHRTDIHPSRQFIIFVCFNSNLCIQHPSTSPLTYPTSRFTPHSGPSSWAKLRGKKLHCCTHTFRPQVKNRAQINCRSTGLKCCFDILHCCCFLVNSFAHATMFKYPTYKRYYTTHMVVMCVRPLYRLVYISGPIRLHRAIYRAAPIVRYRFGSTEWHIMHTKF